MLEQIDHPSVGYRFQHQQLQEFYASRFLAALLPTLTPPTGEEAAKAFAASYINKPPWDEPLRMVAEGLSTALTIEPPCSTALDDGSRLVRLSLGVDPILSADLARLAGPAVWKIVRDEVARVLRRWYSIGNVHHRHLALAAMMATASDEFADIIVPLLTDADRQVRVKAYEASGAFYHASLGPDWRTVVHGWHEDARADFVSEVTHRGRMSDVGEDFARRDQSEKVRKEAIQELCWISATDALERVIASLDDTSLDVMLPAFYPEAVPVSALPRFIAANRRLVAGAATPLDRIRLWLRGVEYGDTTVALALKQELNSVSPPIDQHAAHAIEEALKIAKDDDPEWVSDWISGRLLDGSLSGEHWKTLLRPAAPARCNDLVRRLARHPAGYQELSSSRMILTASATPELAQQIFDELCRLQQAGGKAQADTRQYFDQLRGVFRDLPLEISVAGMLRSLEGEFDTGQFVVVADLFGRVNADADELRSTLPIELRTSLRRYLKAGITTVLARDLFGDEIRSEAAVALGRIGDPDDLAELEQLIDADINRSKSNRTTYANWYLLAMTFLDAPGVDATIIRLLRSEEYTQFAVRSLLQLAMPYRPEKPFFGNTTDYEAIWSARNGRRLPGLDANRAGRYAQAIKECINELQQEATASSVPQQLIARIKDLAVILATLDGRNSAEMITQALCLPSQWDAHLRMSGTRIADVRCKTIARPHAGRARSCDRTCNIAGTLS